MKWERRSAGEETWKAGKLCLLFFGREKSLQNVLEGLWPQVADLSAISLFNFDQPDHSTKQASKISFHKACLTKSP